MSDNFPIAVVTVPIDQLGEFSVSGRTIAAFVQGVVAASRGVRYIEERRYYDGDIFTFGQSGSETSDCVRVVPSVEGFSFFRPDRHYTQVQAVSTVWSDSGRYGYDDDNTRIIAKVREFASALRTAIRDARATNVFPEYEESESKLKR